MKIETMKINKEKRKKKNREIKINKKQREHEKVEG
jgi:hypothetical protein